MALSYDDVMMCLNSRRSRPKKTLHEMRGIDDMEPWLRKVGCAPQELVSLRIIHIAGTNGKGQTSALIAAILKAYSSLHGLDWQVGLYTSPHIHDIRERIQINGLPISKELLTTSFNDIWSRLPTVPTEDLDIPRYLQLLFILALYTFRKSNVNVAVIETHCGGMYDATNVIPNPIVSGISSISLDHTHLLGNTLEEITAQKAGIFKKGCIAVTTSQRAEVLRELRRRANELGLVLEHVPTLDIDSKLSLAVPSAVRQNLSLAAVICTKWITAVLGDAAAPLTPTTLESGFKACQWPGRFDTVKTGRITWFIDGGHNQDGIRQAALWFVEKLQDFRSTRPIIIFGHKSQRDTMQLLDVLLTCLDRLQEQAIPFILTTYGEKENQGRSVEEQLMQQHGYVRERRPGWHTWVTSDIVGATDKAEAVAAGAHAQIFIVGSLKLAGGAVQMLRVVNRTVDSSDG